MGTYAAAFGFPTAQQRNETGQQSLVTGFTRKGFVFVWPGPTASVLVSRKLTGNCTRNHPESTRMAAASHLGWLDFYSAVKPLVLPASRSAPGLADFR
jgi:hypothetical protein